MVVIACDVVVFVGGVAVVDVVVAVVVFVVVFVGVVVGEVVFVFVVVSVAVVAVVLGTILGFEVVPVLMVTLSMVVGSERDFVNEATLTTTKKKKKKKKKKKYSALIPLLKQTVILNNCSTNSFLNPLAN
eukprot:TRINITY_DN5547_c0_g1_i1.p2 TRINITY_DN5547_c0_g1~~TRINITY_DN5547_c0_g1_i1.p2  ORF type:complete len:130 (+),score=45.37 TRINITY_DN5547_c0_g1_i1:250-639(+)